MKLRIGTRSSKLAISQANIVKNLLKEKLNLESEIIHIRSLGDIDRVSPLHTFRGKGVFTSSLEKALLDGRIDIAVHSLKDLPVEGTKRLEIRSYLKRNNPSDTLVIKQTNLLNENPLSIKKGTIIATGSIRRQSQLLSHFPDVSTVNIRGNVDTRLSKLKSDHIDGLIMASAVFDRIDLKIPDNTKIVQLPLDLFPSSPGQGVIVIQSRENEWNELFSLNHNPTEQEVKLERSILNRLVGDCDLGLGLYAKSHNSKWNIFGSSVPKNWWPGSKISVNRIYFKGSMRDFQNNVKNYFQIPKNIEIQGSLKESKVLITRRKEDAESYSSLLEKHGAMVFHLPLLDFKTYYEKLNDPNVIDIWKNSDWILLTSKRAVEFLGLLVKEIPRTNFKIGVVGKITAYEVRRKGLPVHVIAEGTVESLENLLSKIHGITPQKVLYLSGQNITKVPLKNCNRIIVYEAKRRNLDFSLKVDNLVIFSKRSAEHIINQLGTDITDKWIAIGPTTGKYLQKRGLNVITSENPNPEGILRAILGEQ